MSGSRKSRVVVGLIWIGATLSGVFIERIQGPQPTRLSFLSVGQGDCTVFQHQGVTVLIDAGPASVYSDAGARLVTPALKKLGVSRIDLVILTHPDGDHVGGLVALSKRFPIGRIAIARHFRAKPEVRELLQKSRFDDDKVIWSEGCRSARIGSFRMRLMTPEWQPDEPDNDGSLMIQLDNGRASSIISGDASTLEEEAMLTRSRSIHSQVLKVGHHGSRHSSGDSWLSAVAPEFAVVSVGRNNRYGHPAPEVMDRLSARHIRVFRTDRQGDIRFVVGQQGFEIEK